MPQIGDKIRAEVTGEYVMQMSIVGTVVKICGENRLKIEDVHGQRYLVHREDAQLIERKKNVKST